MVSARDQQIRALYKAALERPAAERASFIADLSGGDQELCKSVELMLSRHGATDVGASTETVGDAPAELSAGTRIGNYQLDGVLGRGGMGVVYRATDTKLHRPVAIKFLSIVADEQAKQRFRQEAETTSGLNHPHIVTVYDVGEHDGQQYIVSELVEGGPLDEWTRTNRRKSWRQSIELLTGIADALAAAHAAGILHRDVKPGNVLIDGNGYAKLADFGLAKLVDRDGRDPSKSVPKATRAGLVLGTVAYMSPEQASGQSVDERSDVFSFGILLYELLAGHRPFEAGNELELLKTIVHAPAEALPDGLPELLRMAVDKALQKDPADRYQTMRDLVADLRRVTRSASAATLALRGAESARSSRMPWLVAAGLAALLVAALVPATLYFLRAPPRAARIVYELPAPGFAGRTGDLAISPDATRIAYVANVNGAQRIWVRSIGSLDARELAGTDNAGGLFWSPDGRYIAFTAGSLKRIEAAGGPPQNIADTLLGAKGAWGADGTILFSTPASNGGITVIGRVSANGGSVTPVTAIDPSNGGVLHVFPALLPGGDRFLYVSTGGPSTTVRAASVQRGDLKPVVGLDRIATAVSYAAGFMFYVREGALVAQPFDSNAFALRGTPTILAERVGDFSIADDAIIFSESAVNTLAGTAVSGQRSRRLAWVDRRGQPTGEIDAPAGYMTPVLSPDEHRLAMRAPDPSNSAGDIWTIDIARGVTTRLTSDPADEGTPLFSPDGRHVAFGSGRAGNAAVPNAIYQRATNGTGSDELLFAAQASEVVAPLTWAPDGSFLLFGRASIATFSTKIAVWKLDLSGERTATPLLDAPFVFGNAQLSPDGRWLAYMSTESGASQIVVQSFPDLARDKRQVSTRGGYEPRWRADGRELFYLAPDGALMTIDLPAGDALEPSVPRKLFDTGIPVEATLTGTRPDYFYAVAENGQRFLLNEPIAASSSGADAAAAPTIHVIVNWATGLSQQ